MSTTPDGLEIINTDQFGLVVSASEHNKTVAALKAEAERLKAEKLKLLRMLHLCRCMTDAPLTEIADALD